MHNKQAYKNNIKFFSKFSANPLSLNINFFKAFTLAEVLIVIGIIGVIAEMTIPPLVANFQKQVYVTKLKKSYTEVNQALKQMALNNGCPDDLKCSGLFAIGTNNTTFGDELTKYFKVVKNCGTSTDCWNNHINANYDGSSGTFYDMTTWGYYSFITVDGISFLVVNNAYAGPSNADCSNVFLSDLGYRSQVCGMIYIDVNGLKGPNYYGRDIFDFFITNGKGALLYPEGGADGNTSNEWWNTGNNNRCSSTSNVNDKWGAYCTGRVIEKGWTMDY